jgi:Trypsin-like serine proteases, typically periplasmic, contain C-terminal PDZ domain
MKHEKPGLDYTEYLQPLFNSPGGPVPSRAQSDGVNDRADTAALDAYSIAVVSASEMVTPSVVKIDVRKTGDGGGNKRVGQDGGSGSGMIFTPDGLILTNSHVIHGARHIDVTLLDGRQYQAYAIGDDPPTDVGLIRIDAPDLNLIDFGDSQGICFALAINTAKLVIMELLKEGKVRRSYLGIGGQTVPLHRRIVRYYNLDIESGVFVTSVMKDSPASRSGISEGDMLIEFNGNPITGIDSLQI